MPDKEKKPKVGNDEYYSANAKMLYYRDKLRDKLKEKSPEEFDKFINERGAVMRSSNPMEAVKKADEFTEGYDFKQALTPDEIKNALGDEYDDYIGTLKTIYDSGWENNPAKKLAGENETDSDVSKLMFGKRFATLSLTPTFSETTTRDGQTKRAISEYEYDPVKKKVNKMVMYR